MFTGISLWVENTNVCTTGGESGVVHNSIVYRKVDVISVHVRGKDIIYDIVSL